MLGCEGGAVATGRVDVSTPSEGKAELLSAAAADAPGVVTSGGAPDAVVAGGFKTVLRSRGVYSVVRETSG